MLGNLSNLFGRNFIVGHLLPAAFWSAATAALADAYGLIRVGDLLRGEVGVSLASQVLVLVAVWFVGVSLLAFNLEILGCREGYPLVHPLRGRLLWPLDRVRTLVVRPLVRRQQRRRQRILDALERETGGDDPARLTRLRYRLATEFVPPGHNLLPFRFGNTVRAFEVYPKTMYGFESTRGWSRLLLVLPEDRRTAVETVKAK